MFQKIILICTGNICRSPMAEGLFRSRLSKSDIQICSAGTAALVNHPADPLARTVMQDNGYDVSSHIARQATQTLLTSMDLILALDRTHVDWITARFPHLQGRTHKLGRWQNNVDIADPFRKPREAFEQAYSHISSNVDEWLKRIG